ncbi:MAG: hypothetical protein WCG45_06180 [bacterium]
MNIFEKLKNFIDESKEKRINNSWIDDENMKVYIRKGYHLIEGKMTPTLDIASISVEEEKQNKGFCSQFLEDAHEQNPWDATFVECVLNTNLASHLLRNGWLPCQLGESFYKLKKEIKYDPFKQIKIEKTLL